METGQWRAPAGAARNLALSTLAFLVCFTSWGLVSPIAKKLQTQLHLTDTRTAVLIAVPVLCGSLLRLPFGVLADKYGGRRMFTITMFLSAIPAIAVGYADSFWSLAVVAFLLGGAGAAFAIGVPFVAGWWHGPRLGFAVGIYGLGTIGTALAAYVVPRVYKSWGKVYIGWGMAVILIAVGLIVWALARDAEDRPAPSRYAEVWRHGWRLHRLSLLYFVTFGGFVAMTVYLPTLLTNWFGYSTLDAGERAAGFAAVAVAARPVGGWLADRFGGASVLVVAFAGIAVDAAVLAAIARDPHIAEVRAACLTMGVFLGFGSGAVFKLVPHEFPTAVGAATGIVGMFGGLGGFFPPLIMGVVKDRFDSYAVGFLGLVAFAAVCLLVTLQMQREGDQVGAANEDGNAGMMAR
jgi:NNP family nitrate/nitrite transporter-like MFS transporter